jgi:tRNA(Ile)-lysidine synthase
MSPGEAPQMAVSDPKRGPVALTVDHRLRPDSAAEAQHAQRTAAGLGMEHTTLEAEWPEGRPAHGQLMRRARDLRYSLMAERCVSHGIPALLTGHHAGALMPCQHALRRSA